MFKLCPIYDDTMNTILSQSHSYEPTPSRFPGSAIRYLRQLHTQWRPVVGASAVESITGGVGDGDSGGVGGGKDVTGGQQRPSGGDGGVRRAASVEAAR